MDCPRCGGNLEEFALGDSQSSSCPACGWVGVAVDLGLGKDDAMDESWDSVMNRDGPPGESPVAPSRTESDIGSTGENAGSTSDEPGIPPDLRTLIGIDDRQADRLKEAGIRSVDGLASADPQSLASNLDLPEKQIRPWIRRASILLVTDGAE